MDLFDDMLIMANQASSENRIRRAIANSSESPASLECSEYSEAIAQPCKFDKQKEFEGIKHWLLFAVFLWCYCSIFSSTLAKDPEYFFRKETQDREEAIRVLMAINPNLNPLTSVAKKEK